VIRITTLSSSSLISTRLSSTRIVLCASPEYLNKYAEASNPADLAEHKVIGYSYRLGGDAWEFEGPEGLVNIKIHPWMFTNNGYMCRAVALVHQGIILQPSFLVGADLAAGRLVEILSEYRSVELGIYAVSPTRKHVAPKVRALVNFHERKLSELE
jgi:DNA-binding transcriptional LysR family regulator